MSGYCGHRCSYKGPTCTCCFAQLTVPNTHLVSATSTVRELLTSKMYKVALINGCQWLQVVGVAWLDSQALAVLSEQGPHTHLHLYDASGAPHLHISSVAKNSSYQVLLPSCCCQKAGGATSSLGAKASFDLLHNCKGFAQSRSDCWHVFKGLVSMQAVW